MSADSLVPNQVTGKKTDKNVLDPFSVLIMSKLYSQKNKDLLEKLRSARLEAGLTQIQASKKLKKPQSYLSKIERGERKIEAIELGDFAKIYNKDINYFLK